MGVRADKKAATRQALLEAARSQFTIRGYEGVGIRDLAREIDMSTGAVFGQFPGKDALWEAAMGSPAPSALATKAAIEAAIKSALSAPDELAPRAALLEISLQMNRLVRGLYGEGAA